MELNLNIEGTGYRIDRLEVFNWGTFDQEIHTLSFEGKNALLTGENGSGKSTIVDALLTLFVPSKKRNYNLSSGSDKKERSEVTYVKGAYGKEQNEFGQSKSKFIRKEENFSVLLGIFKNNHTKDLITIGQFFWFENGALRKFYFTTHQNLNIAEHFSNHKNALELKAKLRKMSTTTIHESFSDYENYFIKHFGLRSTKGTDLFNQVVAIKEIGQLNDFVRKHMLDDQVNTDLLDQLYLNYENLSVAHKAILTAKEQLEILTPLATEYSEIKKTEEKKSKSFMIRNLIPVFFNDHKLLLLNRNKKANDEFIEKENFNLEKKKIEIDLMVEQKNQLLMSLNKDHHDSQLEQMNIFLKQYEEKKNERLKEQKKYMALAEKIDLSTDTLTQKNHNAHLGIGKEKLEDSLLRRQTLAEEMYQARKTIEEKEDFLNSLLKDLDALKNSNGAIPTSFLNVRDELISKLDLPKEMLPFVAELITVKPEEKNWKGVVEKLVYSLAQRLLVPEEYYAKINQYLHKTKLNIKLVYNKVDLSKIQNKSVDEMIKAASNDKLFFKLDFHLRSPYRKWIQQEILTQYDYICTDNLKTFQTSFKALMPSGLIKKSHTLHEKDDRDHSRNFNQSILGWDNKELLSNLRENAAHQMKEKDQALKNLEMLKKENQKLELRISNLNEFLQYDDYSYLDWSFWASEIDKIKKQQEKIQGKDNSNSSIRKDQEVLDKKMEKALAEKDQLLAQIAIAKNELSKLPKQIEACEKIKKSLEKILLNEKNDIEYHAKDDLSDASSFYLELEKILQKRKIILKDLPLEDLEQKQNELEREYEKEIQEFTIRLQHAQISLIRKMTNFKHKFSEQSTELVASAEYIDEFLKLKDRLEKEALPEHEKRFKNLLNKSVINDMAAFKSTLELGYENISESIEQLNSSLSQIIYTPTSYVQLHVDRSRDIEIKEFQKMLKSAMSSTNNDKIEGEIEHSFDKIKNVLDKLKKEERWCKKVIDVRNWAEFHVIELEKQTNVQKNYYADSAGLSGGQKAKLAFTILASAIAYQYNLQSSKSNEKSFRFVVIDEAFSKSDEKNSRYAMELFKSLGLQLMVVTPKDKIQIVEPFVNNIFMTKINEAQNFSQMHQLKIGKYTLTENSNQ